jgi:vancomycin resistance protein YoaR
MQTASRTSPRRSATPPSRARPLSLALIGLAALIVVFVGLLVGLRLARPGALPGTVVDEIQVGGMGDDALRRAVGGLAESRGARRVTAQRGAASASGHASELGYELDVDATVAAVLRRGRQPNPIHALADHVRAFRSTIEVPPVESVDEERVAAWAHQAAAELAAQPVEGDVTFEGTAVNRVDPQPGAEVPVEPLHERALAALTGSGERTFEVETTELPTETTVAEVDAVFAAAQRAVSGDVVLTRNDASITFTPDDIAAILRTQRDGATLALVADPDELRARVGDDEIAAVQSDPVDARFQVSGGTVGITESTDGFRFDAQAASDQLVLVATGTDSREAELAGEVIRPGLSTEDAEGLGITEQVSSFTTEYPCCQSRVTNIHRIADMMDGAVIKPGETFSVNDHIGPRTREKGFVEGGAIQAGEFVEEVGGGVSQFATTMFNAAFFGGYKFRQYKAHSYYISRYPVGREATLNYPTVDLAIENNSPHGILVKTSHTATSVTVTFYGTQWVEVSDITGERRNFRDPETRVRENPALRPGSERTVQSGRQGFDVTVVRVLRFPDGREEREEFFTRYLAEPRIIERNSSSPQPPPSPPPPSPPSPPPAPPPAAPEPPPPPAPEQPAPEPPPDG